MCVPACESESGLVWERERESVPGDAAVFSSAEGAAGQACTASPVCPEAVCGSVPSSADGLSGTGECRVAFRFWFCFVLSLRRAAAFEHPLASRWRRGNPIASPIAHKTSRRRRLRRRPTPSDVASRAFLLFLFLPSIVPACHLVRPASVLLRTGERGRVRFGLRVRPAAAVDSGKLRRASQPAAAASLRLRRQRWSLPEATAKCDGAAFVRPRVSVPPAEI